MLSVSRAFCKMLHVSTCPCPTLQHGMGPWRSSVSSPSVSQRRALGPGWGSDLRTYVATRHPSHKCTPLGNNGAGVRGPYSAPVLVCPLSWVHLNHHEFA